MRRIFRLAAAGLLTLSAVATAQGARPALLERVQPGSWTLHEIGSKGRDRSICVRDVGALLQIHHGTAACSRFIVSETARAATVQYSCPGQGYGRTTVTLESPSLVRIQTQGLATGAPFDVDYEARRGGRCAS